MFWIAADQSGAEQNMWIDIARTDEFAVAGLNRDRLAGLEIAQRRGFDIHFVAINPEMTRTQSAIFVLAQAQRSEFSGEDRSFGHKKRIPEYGISQDVE